MVIRKGDDTARSHIQSILEKNKKDKIISTENIVEFLENTVSVGTGVKSFDNNIFKLVDGREVVAGEYNCYISGGEDISIEYRYYMVKKIIKTKPSSFDIQRKYINGALNVINREYNNVCKKLDQGNYNGNELDKLHELQSQLAIQRNGFLKLAYDKSLDIKDSKKEVMGD